MHVLPTHDSQAAVFVEYYPLDFGLSDAFCFSELGSAVNQECGFPNGQSRTASVGYKLVKVHVFSLFSHKYRYI